MLLLMLETGAGDYRTPSSRHQPWSYIPAESAMMSRVIAYRRSDRNRADREIAWFDSARPRVQSDQSKARYATLLIARPQKSTEHNHFYNSAPLHFRRAPYKGGFSRDFRGEWVFCWVWVWVSERVWGFLFRGPLVARIFFFRGAIESKTKVGIWMVVG